MHAAALAYVTSQVNKLGPFDSVLEIGSRNVNGGVRHLFDTLTGLDIEPGDGVDIVADAASWVPDWTYDCVVSCEVFEHTKRWPDIVSTCFSSLKESGVLILTMAGPGRAPHSAVDGGPLRNGEHYENIRPYDLQAVLESVGFSEIEVEPGDGDLYATARR